jgi:hypothetical protein
VRPVAAVSAFVVVLLPACATFGPRIQGQTDLVAWQATDLQLEQKDVGGRRLWFYSFELLIRETRGIPVTFDEIETTVYQPGASPWTGRYQGSWKLDARDEFRIPLSSTLFCHPSADVCGGPSVPIPLWQILMRGLDDRGQAVRTVIDLSLPPDPPSGPQTTSKSVRAITLVPPPR